MKEAKRKLANFVSLLWLQHLKLHLSVPLCFCNSMECISGLMLCSQLSTTSLQMKGCLPSNSKVQNWIHLQNAGAVHLLEQEFSALPLWCKAGDGPHFDLNASVELLVPHVPYSLDWCGYCFVLPVVRRVVLLMQITFSYSNNTQYQYINWVGGRGIQINSETGHQHTLPPYRMEGACRTRPFTSVISSLTITPNSRT